MAPLAQLSREQRGTAYHEAGHAVAAIVLDRPIVQVSIVPDDAEGSLGHVLYAAAPRRIRPDVVVTLRTRDVLERYIVATLAGPAAWIHHRGGGTIEDAGGADDLHGAVDLASYLTGSAEETGAYVEWLRIRAVQLVTSPSGWPAVETLAAALAERDTLVGSKVEAIVRPILAGAHRRQGR